MKSFIGLILANCSFACVLLVLICASAKYSVSNLILRDNNLSIGMWS
jgi:hypothetical protein